MQNLIYKMSTVGGMKSTSLTRYYDMLAGNASFIPAAGSMVPIGAYTVGSTALSSITFGGIPQIFSHLQVRYLLQDNRATYSIDDLVMQFNNDTGANYSWHYMTNSDTIGSVVANGAANASFMRCGQIPSSVTASMFGGGVIDILDYSQTNKKITMRSLNGFDINGTTAGYGGYVALESGSWQPSTLSAVTSITLKPNLATAFTTNSTVALYGVY